jgi:hypothetical protein
VLPRKSSKPDWVKCFACFTIPKPSNFGPRIKQTTLSCCGLQGELKNARSSAHSASTHPLSTLLPLTFLPRLQLAHPVTCFCKVGDEQVWAGTFDSIIMFSNEGEQLHSTSTGAGRMAFIRQGAFSYAPRASAPVTASPIPFSLTFTVMYGLVAGSRPATFLLRLLFFNGPSLTLPLASCSNWIIRYTSSA